MSQPGGIWRRASTLAIWGALGFWVANFAISLTPIAAQYRAALGIAYVPMLLQSLLGGLIIGFCVSYCLLRFFDKIPTKSPVLKSLLLSFVAFIAVTMVFEVPARLFTPTNDAALYFFIGGAFNALRILAMGVVMGYQCGRLNDHARQKVVDT